MLITRANVDQYPSLPDDIIRDIKQNGLIYDTEGGADEDGGWITEGGVVSVDNGVERLIVTPATSNNLPWSKIPTLAD
ncbi:hypothetical protein ACDV62_19750, partial [Proteus mirabilis]